ncbi:MAG: Hsp70 family protein, partial [Mesorhizobium sp.]|nr:Hsp70 family protein [Mesorhizobium sp.]
RVEQAKIALTAADLTHIELPLTGDRLAVAITAQDFDAAIGGAVRRIEETVVRTLADAGLAAGRIETLFLTGGSTAIPQVRAAIVALFPSAKIVEGDVFGSVGLGLALDAERKFR